jgi:hypothetical protein
MTFELALVELKKNKKITHPDMEGEFIPEK